ncbi:MAG: serine/threonine-protein kinase, partial [Gammaproteobacteria bacterium]
DQLGSYEIRDLIAAGGMGRIYRAWDTELSRFVAIKVITAPMGVGDDFQRRFRNEVLHLASVDHPNVVPVYGFGETEAGEPFLAMKLVEGTDLEAKVNAEGPLDAELAAQVVHQVARALDAAHREGLVHRDVKPANILLADADRETHAYLGDFGLTKAAEGETVLTLSGEWIGTAAYAAPEQIEQGEIGSAADVYSLGCVLYFCLAGEPPFSGSPAQIMWSHVNHPLPALPGRVRSHRSLDRVIEQATAKNPAERWPSAGALSRAAVAVTEGLSDVPAVAGPPLTGTDKTIPLSTKGRREVTAAPTTVIRTRKRWPLVAAAAVIAALTAGAVLVLGGADLLSSPGESTVKPESGEPVASKSDQTSEAQSSSEELPTFVRTSLDYESGATAVLPEGKRYLESFGPRRQRTQIDTPRAVAIIDYTPQDSPNPGTGYTTTGKSVSNANLDVTTAEYFSRSCEEGVFCFNYPIDLGGYGFGVLGAADSQPEARMIAMRAARTLDAPAATLQPPDVVDDCISEYEPNVSDMSVRNMSCAEGDDFVLAAIQDLQPGSFQSAGFTCQILGRYGPPEGPILGAENVRCAEGDRAFRFSWGD